MTSRPIPWHLSLGGLAATLLACVTGCTATVPSPDPTVDATTTIASVESTVGEGGTQVLDPGGLEAGTRYVIESLGVSIQPDVDGWFAVMPQGGDAALSREDVTVYFLAPDTVLAPGGARANAPADPQELLDAVDASGIVNVVTTQPFESNGISGLSAELDASGGSRDLVLLTTTSGDYGLVDGQFQWVVIERDGAPVVVSVERADAPDIDAAWEIAGPLVESLDAAR